MFGLFTESFEEFIERNADYMEEVKAKFDNAFPKFSLYNLQYSMYDMFIERNKYKDIGSETEEIFKYQLERKIKEISMIFTPKITVFLENFPTLFERKMTLTSNNNYEYYINPVVSSGNIKLQDKNTTQSETEVAYLTAKSNPQLLKEVMRVENMYYDCLQEFDVLFMGVL